MVNGLHGFAEKLDIFVTAMRMSAMRLWPRFWTKADSVASFVLYAGYDI